MEHRILQEQLFAFYDGELSGALRRAMEAHLPQCAECRSQLVQWRQAVGALFQPPVVAASDAVVTRVMRRLAPQPQPARWPRWLLLGSRLIPVFGLAAVLLLAAQAPMSQAVSIDAFLLADGREPATWRQALSGERASAEDVLALLMEEAR